MTIPESITDRRALLRTLAALPLTAMVDKAGAPPVPLSVEGPNPSAGPEVLQQLIDAQASHADAIVIAPGPPLHVSGPVRVPDNATLVVQRDLVGNPRSILALNGNSTLRFENAHVMDVCITPLAGTIAITGLNYSGRAHLAAILIAGPGPYRNLQIENFRISDANYGIVRQGKHSSLTGATIANGVFRNLFGDPIEWNVCPNDSGLLIDGHDIQGVDAPPGLPFWGIGVGVAGYTYTPDWNPDQSAKHFTIRRITGRSLCQLIHVEAGIDFTIENIRGDDILPRYSARSGNETGAVVCYGCSDFTIADVDADARVKLASGALRGSYIAPCANMTIHDINLRRGDLLIEVGGKASYLHMQRIKVAAGTLAIRGAARDLVMAQVAVTSANNAAEPFVSDAGFLSGPLARFRPDAPTVDRRDITLLRGR